MAPVPVRSKPGLKIPPCPTCGAAVSFTETFEARAAVPAAVADQYATRAPEPGDPNRRIVYVGDPIPDGTVLVGGAPDRDMVHAQPCTCVQHGAGAHRFLLEAINLTYPDVHVEVRVTVPAALLDGTAPSFLAATDRLTAGDVLEAQARGRSPITHSLLAAVDKVIDGLPEPKQVPA